MNIGLIIVGDGGGKGTRPTGGSRGERERGRGESKSQSHSLFSHSSHHEGGPRQGRRQGRESRSFGSGKP